MAIGIVSEADFLAELNSYKPESQKKESHLRPSDSESVTPEIIEMEIPGRKDGDVNVPDSLRKIIGEEAVINGRQSALGLAGMFGISPSSVSAYANGATSTKSYDSPKPSILSHLNKSRKRASGRAGKVLNSALGAITQEKLDYADAKDLSTIAKDMSVIIKNLEPPTPDAQSLNSNSSTPQFVIFAPQFRDERSFDVIHVNE